MTNRVNSSLNPYDFNDLSYTEKALRNIKTFTNDLTGRERQLILLMTNDSEICCKACLNLLDKVDLESLVQRGYLKSKHEISNSNSSESYVDISSPVVGDYHNPVFDVVAGNV